MKKLIIEISYDNHAALLYALNTVKGRIIQPGEFKSVRNGYALKGYLHEFNDSDKERWELINGNWCHVIKSKI